jgi:hypothetical protein
MISSNSHLVDDGAPLRGDRPDTREMEKEREREINRKKMKFMLVSITKSSQGGRE